MDNVYVVTHGSYSDYQIDGIFSTKEKAQEFIDYLVNNKDYIEDNIMDFEYGYGDEFNIETRSFDNFDGVQDKLNNGYKYFHVWMYRNGNSGYSEMLPSKNYTESHIAKPEGSPSFIRFQVCAKSPEHAVKVANERRIQLIANDEWIEP